MKKFITLALSLIIAVSLVACTGGFSGDGQTASADKLVFGTSADYPPFEFHILQDGEDKIVGFEVALAYQIAEDMERPLEVVDMNFDNLLTLMAKGDCDFVIAAMEATPERLESSSASDPYYTDLPAMILTKKANLDQYTSLDSFAGKTVGAQSGSTKVDIINDEMPGAEALVMASVVDLVNNLVYDKCDALVLDGAVALQYAEANSDLAVIEAVSLGDALPYCVWVAKGDPQGLLPGINETIAKVLADGSMERFIEEADELLAESQN